MTTNRDDQKPKRNVGGRPLIETRINAGNKPGQYRPFGSGWGGGSGRSGGGGGFYGGGGATGDFGGHSGSYRGGGNFDAKAKWIVPALQRDLGLTKEQAAGIVGNLGHESGGFKYYQEIGSGANSGGRGWAQWTGPRRRSFLAYSKAQGLDPRGDEASYRYLLHELRTTESGALRAVKRQSTVYGSMKAFELGFERAGVKGYSSRAAYARRAYAVGGPVGVHKGEPPSPNQPQPVYPEGSPLREPQAEKPLSRGPYNDILLPTTLTHWKVNEMNFPLDLHNGRNSVRRVTVVDIDDSKPQQTIWAKGLYGEEIRYAYRGQGHGLSTLPPIGSEGFAVSLAGRPEQMFFIEGEHKDHRPTNQAPGDAVLYDAWGNTIKMEQAGVTHTNGKHTFNGEVIINGPVTITGELNQTGGGKIDAGDVDN